VHITSILLCESIGQAKEFFLALMQVLMQLVEVGIASIRDF
jgi:hypothetical protein